MFFLWTCTNGPDGFVDPWVTFYGYHGWTHVFPDVAITRRKIRGRWHIDRCLLKIARSGSAENAGNVSRKWPWSPNRVILIYRVRNCLCVEFGEQFLIFGNDNYVISGIALSGIFYLFWAVVLFAKKLPGLARGLLIVQMRAISRLSNEGWQVLSKQYNSISLNSGVLGELRRRERATNLRNIETDTINLIGRFCFRGRLLKPILSSLAPSHHLEFKSARRIFISR